MPLELNSAAGNVHLFKLSGALLTGNFNLKKNWIWDVLEINWNNTCIALNDKEVPSTRDTDNTTCLQAKSQKVIY